MKRRTPEPGLVVTIDLGDGCVGVARVVDPPLTEFFAPGPRGEASETGLVELVSSHVVFRLCVMNDAITSGHWPAIGSVPVEDGRRPEVFFKQDPLSGALSLYWEDTTTGQSFSEPATLDECANLEAAAVWSASHVEDRLRDHLSGCPNKWVESLRPRADRRPAN